MTVDIIRERLKREPNTTAERQNHVLRELLQEIALSGLARADFFRVGAFHGGSSLRILHGLRRFSEDLYFILKSPDSRFSWSRFSETLKEEYRLYGVELEVRDRAESKAVKALFLKDQSLGKLLTLRYPMREGQKLVVKLEIDCNPPRGSRFEVRHLTFPVPFAVLAQDLSSGFANKLHAVLCRPYVKGRDWFDFVWYIDRNIQPALPLLRNALRQQGPWRSERLRVDRAWLVKQLRSTIERINWVQARQDVERFLEAHERRGLEVWGRDFFEEQVNRLAAP